MSHGQALYEELRADSDPEWHYLKRDIKNVYECAAVYHDFNARVVLWLGIAIGVTVTVLFAGVTIGGWV